MGRQEERGEMDEFVKAAGMMDRPEILERLFFPRRELPEEARPGSGMPHVVKVAEDVSIGCRFYPSTKSGPSLLYFHGNGEIAADYDYVAPLYQERGINLFVADYRGYGAATGVPVAPPSSPTAIPSSRVLSPSFRARVIVVISS